MRGIPWSICVFSTSTSMKIVPSAVICGVTSSFNTEIGRAPSELQSRLHLVCRLLLEKKKQITRLTSRTPHIAIKFEQHTNQRHLPSTSCLSTNSTVDSEHTMVTRHISATDTLSCPA